MTERALNLAIDQLGHARRSAEVSRQIQQFVEHAGFWVVEEFVGHGIGREMHEPPQIPNFVPTVPDKDRRFDFPIRPGLVLAIEPMVNLGRKEVRRRPDQWTLVTVDGLPSAHFEHAVAITAEGPVRLTGPPTRTITALSTDLTRVRYQFDLSGLALAAQGSALPGQLPLLLIRAQIFRNSFRRYIQYSVSQYSFTSGSPRAGP